MNIQLDGGEVSVIKALGTSGMAVKGESILENVPGMGLAEVMDTVKGLMLFGYVECDDQDFKDSIQFKRALFRINSGYARDLKEAIDPKPKPKKPRRMRRE